MMATHISDKIETWPRRLMRSPKWRSVSYFTLHGLGFVSSTFLMTWGLFVFFFLALGGFSFDGFIRQLNNFTTRYVAADPLRTEAFLNIFAIAHMILSAAVVTLRRDRILPERQVQGGQGHG